MGSIQTYEMCTRKDNLTKIPINTNDDVAEKRDTRRIAVISDVNKWKLFLMHSLVIQPSALARVQIYAIGN